MRNFFEEALETIALAVLIFLILHVSVRNYRVELSSMENTLLPKDRVLVNKLIYSNLDPVEMNNLMPFLSLQDNRKIFFFQQPARGDIIVFQFPSDPTRDFVKRVIGLPGETIKIKWGEVFIDGVPLQESYIQEKDDRTIAPFLVPDNAYFVMGDNRDGSSDSRDWGAVPLENIVGSAWLRYWPWNNWPLPEVSFLNSDQDVDVVENVVDKPV